MTRDIAIRSPEGSGGIKSGKALVNLHAFTETGAYLVLATAHDWA
jgi:hypothetical protein